MVKFSHVHFIWLFGFVILLIILVIYHRWQRKQDLKVFSGHSLSLRLLDYFEPRLRNLKEYLLIASILFISLAAIGPQVGKKLTEVKRKGVDIILALDTSLSMNAEDLKPNRLMRAKYEAGKFIDQLRGDRVGIVAFAGISYLQCPLTLDYSAAKLFLDILDTGIIGTQGTAIADAIQTSINAFKEEDKKYKVIILVSDGEDHEGDLAEIKDKTLETGVIVHSVGVGTLSGAPIPVIDKKSGSMDFKKDRSGRVVTSALQEQSLQELAAATGGKYYNMSIEADVFGKIYKEILSMEQKEIRSHEYSDYEQRYQIFLVIGLILIVMEILIPEKIFREKEWKGRFE